MAGSSEHWRDVYSNEAWKKILETATPTVAGLKHSDGSDLLAAIGRALATYHAVPKTDPTHFEQRRGMLLQIQHLAEGYLKGVTDAGKQVAAKSVVKGRDPVAHKGAIYSPVAVTLEKNLDPWIHSLARRASKKREYLAHLNDYVNRVGAFRSAGDFQKYVGKRMCKTAPEGLLRLTQGTKLEQVDPLHRDFEHVTAADGTLSAPATAMSQALIDWIADNGALAFFVFLEGHPVSTRTRYLDSDYKPIHRITYGKDGGVRQVWIQGNQLVARPFSSQEAPTALTTSPGGSKRGEAYVWVKTGELFIHSHLAGQYHHSSFNEGHKVRCAGTLVAVNGALSHIDNNSGHYQPTDRHYLTLLMILQREGVAGTGTEAGTHAIHGDLGFVPSYTGFATMKVSEYLEEARKKGVLSFVAPADVQTTLKYHA
jgi:hypothetical protein